MEANGRSVLTSFEGNRIFDAGFKAGKQEGIREVVDSLDWESTIYETVDGSPIIRMLISKAEWQSKLKEWGIDQPVKKEEIMEAKEDTITTIWQDLMKQFPKLDNITCIREGFKAGMQKGIREVIATINTITDDIPTSHQDTWRLFWQRWQAKLKEWGDELSV